MWQCSLAGCSKSRVICLGVLGSIAIQSEKAKAIFASKAVLGSIWGVIIATAYSTIPASGCSVAMLTVKLSPVGAKQ